MIELEPGQNPREHLSRHRERGSRRMYYTTADLARLYGVSVAMIYRLTRGGHLDPTDLESICRVWRQRHKSGS